MKRLALLLPLLLACGGDSTAPDPLAGDWWAVSMNGAALPATYDFGLLHFRVVSRELRLIGTGGWWNDSTVLTTDGVSGPVVFDDSRAEFIKWTVNGSRLSVTGSSPTSQLALFFLVQSDGTLVSDFGDGMTVVYRR